MITLLVAFFMMMYSMSVLNMEKFKQAAVAIRSGFNGPAFDGKDSGDSIIEKSVAQVVAPQLETLIAPPDFEKSKTIVQPRQVRKRPGPTTVTSRAKRVAELVEKINLGLQQISPGKTVKVIGEKKGVAVELIGEPIFFPKNTAQLSPHAKIMLSSLARILSNLPNEISVEGHSSLQEAKPGSPFPNSWELSTARGTTVVEYLLSAANIDPKLVSVTGYGHYRPSAAKEEDNNRVRVFIYQE
jgi:chemotaxis protein MotB